MEHRTGGAVWGIKDMNEGHALFLLMIGAVVVTLALNMVVQGVIG